MRADVPPRHRRGAGAAAAKTAVSRRLALPLAIQNWSLTSLQQRLFKTGGRLIQHARYFTLQLAESYLTRPLFRQIVARIAQLAWHPT
ncbi:MAG: transposase [Candidatus Rokubacteria bacterium]|nr:transposase [Candidatus Rokubacteria bacterium]